MGLAGAPCIDAAAYPQQGFKLQSLGCPVAPMVMAGAPCVDAAAYPQQGFKPQSLGCPVAPMVMAGAPCVEAGVRSSLQLPIWGWMLQGQVEVCSVHCPCTSSSDGLVLSWLTGTAVCDCRFKF